MVTALDQVWQQTLKEMPDGLKDRNWITVQLIANNGSMNYCVRWNTDAHNSTAADRTKITAALQRSLQKWFNVLVSFEGFPLTKLTVKTIGYAVKDKSIIQGSTTGLDIYTTADADGFLECDTRCYRGAHLDDPNGISLCPGGEESRYDISLWLDSSLEGRQHSYDILLHEMGHGFGLLEFYDWVPSGQTSFIMMAGSAMEITEFDVWMLRDWYRKLKVVRGW
ncbi:hypothetical protein EJ07DRAFT_174908 [Lizonia empirigonia]|nr:hypothetical protein EJ07DRAFT_174908 [Lizonia empirigonia]